ncbi:hypothetical protein [Gloeobacter morelensis]|uniref:DUF2191 domain-containing protein n=1 Tax=Gloeobacter morelensis MG652769 TaxID=2781736 RepID=A0ABY3PJC6_9CYAN|nr:hypothetical protein [Gloeobacter morelensis]UFP93757.1 DUF2191 domain-containing protein [Gloeobacter morelensis MG652769]
MRTTLSLDDDVSVQLVRLQKTTGKSFKQVVNDALRLGLQQMSAPTLPRRPYSTPTVDLGPSLIGSLDKVSEVLAIVEGEAFR